MVNRKGNFMDQKTPVMRIAATIFLLVLLNGCGKKQCTNMVEITNTATTCGNWGLITGGNIYPSENIPDNFKINGLKVCCNYQVYQVMQELFL
jgi:hypothetical protein